MNESMQGEEQNWEDCTLAELCQRIALDEHFVVQCVEQGIAEAGGQPSQWRFSATAVLRIRKAWRLHRDLDIQLGNLALVLELLDERDQLLREVAMLRQRVLQWEREA